MILLLVVVFWSCQNEKPSISVQVKNSLDIDRSFETVEISAADLADLNSSVFHVIHKTNADTLISQTIDYDADGQFDVLLFQPELKANESKTYQIFASTENQADTLCYSRFVPERTDDYAWENNRVAFRTYGPKAQQMVEDSIKGGTLSSGIDAWLKRVEYPIINKWYEKHTSGKGSYHEDTGEGLDNFHVGISRGVGGIAFKNDSTYAVSKNFKTYKTIANGPLRTIFELGYGDYTINGQTISETKTISLDYGQNLSKFSVALSGTDEVSAGLTLHDNTGETTTNKAEGWMSYWEPHDGSKLGQGLVVENLGQLMAFDKYISDEKDQSNLFAQLRLNDETVTYYAGFGWKKSGQFTTKAEWNDYLSTFSICVQNPLILNVTNED